MSTINVNTISDAAGSGAPNFPDGVQVAGNNVATAGSLSNRNMIINGSMQVWQRGTSQTTSGSYGADRFWMANAASASRNTDVPSGFAYSTKLTYSASDMAIGQPIELPDTGRQGPFVSGEVVTLSYYAKVDSGTEAVATSIRFRDNKFSSSNEVSFTPTVTGGENATWTTTWTRYSHSFTVPTASATNVLAGLEITGIGKDAYITGVQLEAGDVATPFEVRPIGQELSLCQRYYQTGTIFTQQSYSGGNWYMGASVTLATEMRTTPSVGLTITGSGGYSSNLGTQAITSRSVGFNGEMNSAGSYMFVDYTADAEL